MTMSKLLQSIDYYIANDHVYFSSMMYRHFEKSDMILLADDSALTEPEYENIVKISIDKFNSQIKDKLLVIITIFSFDAYKFQHELAKINKNTYIGIVYLNGIRHGSTVPNMPIDMSRIVLLTRRVCKVDDDFRGNLSLENVYICHVGSKSELVDDYDFCFTCCTTEINVEDTRHNLLLPYNCTVKYIDDFNELINLKGSE